MEDSLNVVLGTDFIKQVFVHDGAFDEDCVRVCIEVFFAAGVHVVEDDWSVSAFEEGFSDMGADESGASGDKIVHGIVLGVYDVLICG